MPTNTTPENNNRHFVCFLSRMNTEKNVKQRMIKKNDFMTPKLHAYNFIFPSIIHVSHTNSNSSSKDRLRNKNSFQGCLHRISQSKTHKKKKFYFPFYTKTNL